jgi:thiol-disulfide isomerase/thioredoxin
MKKNILILFLLSFTTLLTAQSYKFSFKIKGAPSGLCKLGYYRGENTITIDSVQMDSLKGEVVFKGDKKLVDGQYFFFLPGKGVLDFIVNGEYKQQFQTYLPNIMDSVTVKGSKENSAYFEYLSFNRKQQAKVEQFKQTLDKLRKESNGREGMNELEKQVRESSKTSQDYEKEFIEKHAKLFVPKLIKSRLLPIPPKNISPLTFENKPNVAYHVWLNRHFWDDFDFNDTRLLYSRVYPGKLQAYYEQYSSARPDSVIQSAELVFEKCKQNKDVFRYNIEWLTKQMEFRRTGGTDNVIVHLYDKYYSKDTSLADLATRERIKNKAELYRPNLINNIAPKFELLNNKDSLIVLDSIKSKFTVLYFFSPFCAPCKEKTPVVADAVKDYIGKGAQLLAITIDEDKEVWKEWAKGTNPSWVHLSAGGKDSQIQKKYAAYNLPMIYILDENKKIIGKNIRPEDLGRLLKIGLMEKK